MPPKGNKNVRRSPRAPRKRRDEAPPPATAPEPKRRCADKKSQDGRVIDIYCWLCHKVEFERCPAEEEDCENCSLEPCFTCPRVHHLHCLENKSGAFNEEGACPECQLESIDGTKLSKTLTCERLKELLLVIMSRKIPNKENDENKMFFSWPQNITVGNVIDFPILIDKINDSVPYTKTSEFFSDVKWIEHNCMALYGADSKVTKAAKKLVKAFKTDLLDLEACPECYFHMHCSTVSDFFVRLCDPPHDIIWAQVLGYPYWPAKCLKIVNGSAHVRFFGRHEIGKIPINHCYFISKEHPNHPQKSIPKTPKYNAAMLELRQYVRLYERTAGGLFNFYDKKVPYNPENAVPRPIRDVPEQLPRVSKLNIAPIPICIDLIERERRTYEEEGETSNGNSDPIPSTSAGVTIDMTFTEEQNRASNNDFDSSESLTSTSMDLTSTPIDIQSCTATTVVTSTPVVASTDSLINLQSDELSLGAELHNSNTVNESDNNEVTMNNSENVPINSSENLPINDSDDSMNAPEPSEFSLATESDASENILPSDEEAVVPSRPVREVPHFDFFRELSSVVGRFPGLIPLGEGSTSTNDDDVITDASGSLAAPRAHVDDSLIVSYLSSQGKAVSSMNKDFKSVMYTLFVNMWSLANNAPSAAEVLTTVLLDLRKLQDLVHHFTKDNENLRRRLANNKNEMDELQDKIEALERSLDDAIRRNEDVTMEFLDATKNAKLVVKSMKHSSDSYWSSKIKEYVALYNRKLHEKDEKIAQCEKLIKELMSDNEVLHEEKKDYQGFLTSSEDLQSCPLEERFHEGIQTELSFSEVFDKTDIDSMIKENTRIVKHTMECELNEQIVQAKRDICCFLCLKPANIHCCMSANYCTSGCQQKHSKAHKSACQRRKSARTRLTAVVPQHEQFCHPMMNPLNHTQTYARETLTSIRVQLHESSNIITTAINEPNPFAYPIPSTSMNMPLNLMTTNSHSDRFVPKPALLPTPPPATPNTPGITYPTIKRRRLP